MTASPDRYRVHAEPNGGTAHGGHMRGYAWGPPVVNEITFDSFDRYRVTLNNRTGVLLVQPMQASLWDIPNGKTADSGVMSIDGDGTWTFPQALPDVTIGEPMDFRVSFAPYEYTAMWHATGPVTAIRSTLNGVPDDRMTTARGAVWIIKTVDGPVHEFNFTQKFPRHRRFPDSQAAAVDGAHDLYVGHYSLHDIETLKIGHPLNIEALSLDDERPLTDRATVATITNLFDHTLSTADPS